MSTVSLLRLPSLQSTLSNQSSNVHNKKQKSLTYVTKNRGMINYANTAKTKIQHSDLSLAKDELVREFDLQYQLQKATPWDSLSNCQQTFFICLRTFSPFRRGPPPTAFPTLQGQEPTDSISNLLLDQTERENERKLSENDRKDVHSQIGTIQQYGSFCRLHLKDVRTARRNDIKLPDRRKTSPSAPSISFLHRCHPTQQENKQTNTNKK